MKVAVVGNGHVGVAVFRELQEFREIRELVLVGRNAEACRAEAIDYMDAIPLRMDTPGKIWGGGYELAKDADVLVYTAGPPLTGQDDRMAIVDSNVKVMKSVFSEVDKYAPNAIVVVVTNPLDVITTAIQKYTGRPAERVIGTGTLLDSARMIQMLSWAFKVSPRSVSGYVLGEHGNSAVPILSSVNIMNMHYEDYLKNCCNGEIPLDKEITADVREAGFKIFRGKGYTSAGVAAAVARVVFDIVNDENEALPVSTVLHGEYGADGFAMSVPCIVGKNGIHSILNINMTDAERDALKKSAAIIEEVCKKADF